MISITEHVRDIIKNSPFIEEMLNEDLLNLSAYYLYKHENKIAKKYLQHLHKLYPKNEKVNIALNKL